MMFKWLLALGMTLGVGACGAPAETYFVRTEGADMPIRVQGNLAAKRLMVHVHGGPGGTAIARAGSQAFTRLEKSVAMAYWDQRGAGNAQGDARPESLVIDRHVADLDVVVDLLRQRYPGLPIYLFGHSWGGTLTARYLADPARQAKVAGWLGVDGAYSMPETLRLAREWGLARAKDRLAQGRETALASEALQWMEAHPQIQGSTLNQQMSYLRRLGAYVHDPATAQGPDRLGLTFFHPYSIFGDLMNNGYTIGHMDLDALVAIDALEGLAAVTVPALLVNGRHDGAVPVGIAEQAFAKLGTAASAKTLAIFEASGHDPMREEPEAFCEAVERFFSQPAP